MTLKNSGFLFIKEEFTFLIEIVESRRLEEVPSWGGFFKLEQLKGRMGRENFLLCAYKRKAVNWQQSFSNNPIIFQQLMWTVKKLSGEILPWIWPILVSIFSSCPWRKKVFHLRYEFFAASWRLKKKRERFPLGTKNWHSSLELTTKTSAMAARAGERKRKNWQNFYD